MSFAAPWLCPGRPALFPANPSQLTDAVSVLLLQALSCIASAALLGGLVSGRLRWFKSPILPPSVRPRFG